MISPAAGRLQAARRRYRSARRIHDHIRDRRARELRLVPGRAALVKRHSVHDDPGACRGKRVNHRSDHCPSRQRPQLPGSRWQDLVANRNVDCCGNWFLLHGSRRLIEPPKYRGNDGPSRVWSEISAPPQRGANQPCHLARRELTSARREPRYSRHGRCR
jgi:hypothetical protein